MKFGLWSVMFFSLLFFACRNCDNTECISGIYFSFTPVDSVGKELLTMPDSIYNKDSIMILPKEAVGRISFHPTWFTISLNPSFNEFTINWSRNKIDTFKMDFTIEKGDDCCGRVINSLSLSNQDSIINHYGTIRVVVP